MRTDAVEHLIKQLYRLGLVQREIARHASAELGSQGFVALAVVHAYGPVRISDVAHRLNVDLSVASRQVAALAAAGYVRREADPEDRRAHRVTITEAGRHALADSHRRMVDAFGAALQEWDEGDIDDLSRGLARLREDFTSTCEATPAGPPTLEEVTA
jgi:DNA-binding MarR family transcriptional regulator